MEECETEMKKLNKASENITAEKEMIEKKQLELHEAQMKEQVTFPEKKHFRLLKYNLKIYSKSKGSLQMSKKRFRAFKSSKFRKGTQMMSRCKN
jgi:hypothetical protein